MSSRADALLAGPRGRRLCLELVQDAAHWPPVGSCEPEDVSASLAARVAATDLAAVGRPERLLDALIESMDQARYWQPPDDADELLADPGRAVLLAPVAEAVVAASASEWWTGPVATGDQHVVVWPTGDPPRHPTPQPTRARAELARWRAATVAEERRAAPYRWSDPADAVGGTWESAPVCTGVLETSRVIRRIAEDGGVDVPAPAGLEFVEDESGWRSARSWPVGTPASARVLEVDGPAGWVALVERYPLDVSAARRGTWGQVTGWDGGWLTPDWSAVAADVDAVHLTVDGYLSAATRSLPVDVPGTHGPARTMLAGAAPDATWWLGDVPLELGPPTDWRRQAQHRPRWTPA